jgi:C4-dicarboxylate transporter, DctM subunit
MTMDPVLTGLIGLAAMFVLIALQVPIGIAMGTVGVVGCGLMIGWGPALSLVGTEPSSAISSTGLAVIAMFLLMGSLAHTGGLSGELYRLAYAFVGHRRGGLAMATIAACAGFGAVCGSSVATAATMANVALPEMISRKYSKALAAGTIAAGGTLGMIIPPSVLMILYGILTENSIIALFLAGIVPGLIAVAGYVGAVAIYTRLFPDAAPIGPRASWKQRRRTLADSWAVILLAAAVSGGIYSGIFTVTEAASVGAVFAFGISLLRRRLTRASILKCFGETATNTGLIFVILIGASVFSYFATLSGLPGAIVTGIKSLNLPPYVVILLLELMYLVLGSIFDTVAAMVLTLPFVYPLVTGMGFDPIWWGVINIVVMEIGMITPPIGINVFVLHGVAEDLPLNVIFRGIVPFLVSDILRLLLLTFVPQLSIWLPHAAGWM